MIFYLNFQHPPPSLSISINLHQAVYIYS